MSLTPTFETAFTRHERELSKSAFLDILDSLEDGITKDPRACGEPHPNWADGTVYVYEAPPVARLPRITILYSIDDAAGRVRLHNFTILGLRGRS